MRRRVYGDYGWKIWALMAATAAASMTWGNLAALAVASLGAIVLVEAAINNHLKDLADRIARIEHDVGLD